MNLIFLLLFTLVQSQTLKKWPTKVIAKITSKNKTVKIATTSTANSYYSFIQDSDMWVDKSMLIKRILESSDDIFKIMAPFGWGKTLNMDMVKFYAQLTTDDEGTVIEPKNTHAYLYFVEGRIFTTGMKKKSIAVLFDALDDKPMISTYTSVHNKHLAKYPVIHLRGGQLDAYNLSTFVDMIWNAYQEHEPVRKLILKNETQKLRNFDDFYDYEKLRKLPSSSLKSSIRSLCQLLNEKYKNKVLVLFDDYDTYIQKAYFQNTRTFEITEKAKIFMDTIKGLMDSTFRENPALAKAVITGVLNIPQDTESTEFHEEDIFVFSDRKFSPYYGISQGEFSTMMKKADFDQEFVDEAKKWYGGYTKLSHPGVSIFSPASLTKCISERKIDNYLVNSSLIDIVPKLLEQSEFKKDIGDWIKAWNTTEYQSMNISSSNIFTAEKLADMQRVELGNQKYDKKRDRSILFSLLFTFGLPTLESDSDISGDSVVIRPPNIEVCDYLKAESTKTSNIKENGKSQGNNLKTAGKSPTNLNPKTKTIQGKSPTNPNPKTNQGKSPKNPKPKTI